MAYGDDSLTVSSALTQHYFAHRLPPDGGQHASWFRVRVGPFVVPLPNPPARRRAVFYHDVNHVLTGYDTSFAGGEVAIAAFEIGSGCGRVAIAWYINLVMMALGLVLRPRAAFEAFVRGRHSGSIYRRLESRTQLEQQTVAALRRTLNLHVTTTRADRTDRLHFALWSTSAVFVFLATLAFEIAVLWGVGLLLKSAIIR